MTAVVVPVAPVAVIPTRYPRAGTSTSRACAEARQEGVCSAQAGRKASPKESAGL